MNSYIKTLDAKVFAQLKENLLLQEEKTRKPTSGMELFA